MEADVLVENHGSIELLQHLGFRVRRDAQTGPLLRASVQLTSQRADFSCNAAFAY
jgi:hypothetical protein